eukprot:TRINITY_DN67_c0_g1_i3.p1 TRINITY_DN67_c0_g1~~TRINITY_DN67_c0_g1_i3.p1  ORF type:complete len:173 (+),score=29.68 TRINITY_DN67_c0_g1_i3:149-667(+)
MHHQKNLYGPPYNHKMITVAIEGVVDLETDGELITYNIISIQQDEPVCGTGSGDTEFDAICSIKNQNQIEIRRERSGNQDGRFYHIAFQAFDNLQNDCTGTITVGIGHDAYEKKDRNEYKDQYIIHVMLHHVLVLLQNKKYHNNKYKIKQKMMNSMKCFIIRRKKKNQLISL